MGSPKPSVVAFLLLLGTMSMLTVLGRNTRMVQQRAAPMRIARRNLGDSVAGPPLSDIGANTKFAVQFFTKNPGSYAEFKQQCISLRIFAMAGVLGYCALGL